MSDHDPLCQKGHSRTSRCWGFIDEIRADERERWGRGWIATANMVSAMTAAEKHAEAVAARLVEVICEQERSLKTWRRLTWQANAVYAEASSERDAARAEASEVRERLRAQVEALPTTRTRAWDKGWDSVSLNDVLALLGGDS